MSFVWPIGIACSIAGTTTDAQRTSDGVSGITSRWRQSTSTSARTRMPRRCVARRIIACMVADCSGISSSMPSAESRMPTAFFMSCEASTSSSSRCARAACASASRVPAIAACVAASASCSLSASIPRALTESRHVGPRT
jgi:hypothetical protein